MEESKKDGPNIPPGSMGCPFIGETLAFRKVHASTSIGEFMEEHIRKYGKIFSSNLFGYSAVVSADAELNQFMVSNDGKLFEPNWPVTVPDMLGKKSMLVVSGELHAYLKSNTKEFLTIDRLSHHFLKDLEGYTLKNFSTWKEGDTFPAMEMTKEIAFNLMVKNLMSMKPGEPETERLRELYASFTKGVTALPINFPGTTHWKANKARIAMLKIIEQFREERKKKKEDGTDQIGKDDLLGYAMDTTTLDGEQLGDHIIEMLFAGYETLASVFALLIYFLESCPKAVEQLREEHLNLVKRKQQKGEPKELTWEDYQSMEFAKSVVHETLRKGNVVKLVYRKATSNVEFKGYDIPSGWSVIGVFAAAHLDETAYENPKKFDPWRWQTTSASTAAKTGHYMPFSHGVRSCAGYQLAPMAMSVFLHHLVLNFDWEVMEPDPPVTYSFAWFASGLPIKVRKLSLVE